MERRKLVVDAAIAVLAFGFTLAMLASRGLGTADPDTRSLDTVGVLLALLSTLPVAARRAAPGWDYLVTALASLALLYLDYGLDVPLGPVVAAYGLAVAYGADARPARRWLALLAVASFVPAVALGLDAVGVKDIARMVPGMLAWAALFAAAWIAGDRTRLRAERIRHLEEQARRMAHEAERERRLAAAEERTRIARELHDSAGHAINVILVQAGAARLLHGRDPAGSQRAILTIEQVARDTIDEIDRIVRVLRTDDASGPGAEVPPADPAALEDLVQRHRASGLRVSTELRGPGRALPRSVAWATYRILQEALTNAARHGSGRADVAVRYDPDAVEITVTNPVPVATAPHREGHGIVGMRERATLLGGALDVGLGDDGVFRLHARLPHADHLPQAQGLRRDQGNVKD